MLPDFLTYNYHRHILTLRHDPELRDCLDGTLSEIKLSHASSSTKEGLPTHVLACVAA